MTQGYLSNLPPLCHNVLPSSYQTDSWSIIQQASATARHNNRSGKIINTTVQVLPNKVTEDRTASPGKCEIYSIYI